MSHEEEFKDTTGVGQILLLVVAIVVFPLLPMLMGRFNLLR
ncbi:hypothetical protein [Colwellia maritima]|nr:hypothetical protein [Colwellia maritima]